MRSIPYAQIVDTARDLFLETHSRLRPDVLAALQDASSLEIGFSHTYLQLLLQNAALAEREGLPLSRDPGILAWFAEIGSDLSIDGGLLQDALREGIQDALEGDPCLPVFLEDPLLPSKILPSSLPSSLHVSFSEGDELRLACLRIPHTAEMASQVRVLPPHASHSDILEVVTSIVAESGPLACPPLVIGVGIGGLLDTVTRLAQTALLRPIGKPHQTLEYARFEQDLLSAVNQLRLGPGSLGGKTTALAVHLHTAPTHRAAIPIAVYLQHYALRSAQTTL